MNETKTIGYKVGCGFELAMPNDYKICFDVVLPSIYHTSRDAEKARDNLFAKLKQVDNEIVLKLYEGVIEIDEIKSTQVDKCKIYECDLGNEKLLNKNFDEIFRDYCAELSEKFAGKKAPKLLRLTRFKHWLEPVTADIDVNKILVNERNLWEEELVSDLKFRGVICEETILIDDLVRELIFDPIPYFKGRRLNRTKFETEILTQDKLKFRRKGFYRFWKFSDGNYYKKVTKENGFHIGYTLRFVKFELEKVEPKPVVKVEEPQIANEVTEERTEMEIAEKIEVCKDISATVANAIDTVVKENEDILNCDASLDDDTLFYWANVDCRTIIPEEFFNLNEKVGE